MHAPTLRTRTLALVLVAGCSPSERSPHLVPPAASVSAAAPPAVAPDALRVLVLEPHLVPSELGLEWGSPRPWSKSGAAVVESQNEVWSIDPTTHVEKILARLVEPDRRMLFVGSGGGRSVYEIMSWGDNAAPSTLVVVDVEAGSSRALPLEANETLRGVSADGRRVLSIAPTERREEGPFAESKLPATLRVRDLATLALVKEWRAASGVRYTQPGLSRMAISRDGAYVFLPGSTRDELHEVERGAVVWSAKARADSRAEFGAGFVAVGAPSTLSIVDLATGNARTANIGCGGGGDGETLDILDVEQKLLARECERGVLLADWSSAKPVVTRVKGTTAAAIGPNGAVSMVREEALWLRTSRSEPVRSARPGETAVLRTVGPVELRRGAGDLQARGTCTLGARIVRCDTQLSPDGTRAYEAADGALGFFDPASPGAAGAYVHQLAAPNADEQPRRADVRVRDRSLVVGELEIPVHPPKAQAGPDATPLRTPDPQSAYPDVAFAVGGLDFYHEPGRTVAQTMWAAPTATKRPTLRLLFGAGFALVWDAHNQVQVAGDRIRAAHWLRCVRGEGAQVQLLPFSTCQAQVEKTLL